MSISIEQVCPKCNGPVEVRIEGSTQGLYCTKCDWAVVTTNVPEIRKDAASYEVRIVGGDARNEVQIKAVSEISGENFLAARKILQAPGAVVFKGRAVEVVGVRDALDRASISYKIEPDFRY